MSEELRSGAKRPGAVVSEPPVPTEQAVSRRRWRPASVRILVAVAVLAALVLVVRDQGAGLRHELGRVPPADLVGALALGLAAVWFSLLSWRAALAAVGARLPVLACVRVFLPSQLGKYLPGSVWPVVAQSQLGQRYGIARTRMATGSLLALGLSVVVASAIGAVLLPLLAGSGDTGLALTVVLAAAVVVGAACLHPRVLGPLLDRVLRLLRRPPVGRLDGREIARAAGAAAVAWLLFGAHAALLTYGLGGRGLAPVIAVIGLPLSSAAGILVVLAPAGAGVRETVLVLLLRGRLGTEAATALVLLSRGLLAAADLLAAAVGAGTDGLMRRREGPRPAPRPVEPLRRSR